MGAVKLDICEPFILTIPDECVPFLILKKGSKPFDKFVMENYISFHAYDYQNDTSDGFCLRFENYIAWETLGGFSSLHVPLSLQKNLGDPIGFLTDALERGYILMCDYNTFCVEAASSGKPRSHRVILYGCDREKRRFFCRDFIRGSLRPFEAGFDEMGRALQDYPWPGEEKGGTLGLRYDGDFESGSVSICKLYTALCSLCSSDLLQRNNGVEAFGRRALSVFRGGILHYSSPEEQAYRCSYWMNYVRESCKLMEYRLQYLKNCGPGCVSSGTEERFRAARQSVETAFMKLLKYEYKQRVDRAFLESTAESCGEIEEAYMEFAGSLLEDCRALLKAGVTEVEQSRLYASAERYSGA